MGTQANVIVGLCDGSIKIGPYGTAEGSADDLGYTEGGVELAIAREYFEKTVDQEIGVLAEVKFQNNDFEDVSYYEHFYLKEFRIAKPKVKK